MLRTSSIIFGCYGNRSYSEVRVIYRATKSNKVARQMTTVFRFYSLTGHKQMGCSGNRYTRIAIYSKQTIGLIQGRFLFDDQSILMHICNALVECDTLNKLKCSIEYSIYRISFEKCVHRIVSPKSESATISPSAVV